MDEHIGRRLKSIRMDRGLSQRQLARVSTGSGSSGVESRSGADGCEEGSAGGWSLMRVPSCHLARHCPRRSAAEKKICVVCTRFVSAQTADGGISDGGGLEESRVGRARE